MPPAAHTPRAEQRPNRLLPLIAVFKLGKALALFGLAYAFRHLRHASDIERQLVDWVRDLRVDPDTRISRTLIAKATGISPERLHALGIGTFFYALLFATEGTGLLLRQRWAEYCTVVSTTLFLPLEIWEVAHPGHRAGKAALLLANAAIIAYLIWNLKRTRKPEPRLAPAVAGSPPDPVSAT